MKKFIFLLIIAGIGTYVPENIFTNVFDAMKLKFDDTKINEYYNCKLVCDKSTACFKDPFSNDCGYATYKNNGRNTNECITDLMVYIKYHIERQFKQPIDLLTEVCTPQKQARQLTKTGNYFQILNIIILKLSFCILSRIGMVIYQHIGSIL